PLFGRPEQIDKLVELRRVLGRVLEPRKEVERLAKITTVVEPARDPWQVREAGGDVSRPLLEDRSPLVLRELPPFLRLLNGDKGGTRGPGTAERRGRPVPVLLPPG